MADKDLSIKLGFLTTELDLSGHKADIDVAQIFSDSHPLPPNPHVHEDVEIISLFAVADNTSSHFRTTASKLCFFSPSSTPKLLLAHSCSITKNSS